MTNRTFVFVVLSMLFAASALSCKASDAPAPTEETDLSTKALCDRDGNVQTEAFRSIRELLRALPTVESTINKASVQLESARRTCKPRVGQIDSEMIAILELELGDKWLTINNFANAKTHFLSARMLLEQHGEPSANFLRVLRALSLVSAGEGDLNQAEALSASQLRIARELEKKRALSMAALTTALRFHAHILELLGRDETGNDLIRESELIEQRMRDCAGLC